MNLKNTSKFIVLILRGRSAADTGNSLYMKLLPEQCRQTDMTSFNRLMAYG